jgi:DNA adenine methylase Dam
MRQLPAATCDVAIADPPYNVSKGGDWKWDNSVKLPGFGGNWSKVKAAWDDMTLADYLQFTISWLMELKRIVCPTGSIWVHGTYHNIGIINFAMQLLGIEIINEVVWYKRNSFPNLSGRRLTASHETILWAHTGGQKRQYHFDYDFAKKLACPEDGLKEPGKQMRTVWDIPNNKDSEELRFGKHPTQKPLRLITRMLQISARSNDLVLVPFAGAGSECVAASRLDMRYLGFEINAEYFDICRRRLELNKPPVSDPIAGIKIVEAPSKKYSLLSIPRKVETIPSLIKWTGSKRSQAIQIAAEMPPYRRYIEPFLGGGALLYLVGGQGSLAGDVYSPLIELWKLFQRAPVEVIANYRVQWEHLQKKFPDYYYVVRDRFNHHPNPLDLNFLMRTCVNGIVRFNDQGEFNNSFHLSRRGMEPDRFEDVVTKWNAVIQEVKFLCQDYEATLSDAREGDFAYLDPPYAGNRQRYVRNLDIDRFWNILDSLNSRGVKWALSFDGRRGEKDLSHDVPQFLYKRRLMLTSGNSAVHKVLNGPIERVDESLYLNY